MDIIRSEEKKDEIRKITSELENEVKHKISHYIITAFGLVAGLAWNELIKETINYLFPLQQGTILAKFAYAIIVTLVLVSITVIMTRISPDKKKKTEKEEGGGE